MPKKQNMPEILATELPDGGVVEFCPTTSNWGRAEFDFCVVTRRHKIRQIYIVRRQQKDHGETFLINCDYGADSMSVWSEVGLGDPRPWRWYPCEFHKAMGTAIYVPDGSNYLRVMKLSSISIMFGRR